MSSCVQSVDQSADSGRGTDRRTDWAVCVIRSVTETPPGTRYRVQHEYKRPKTRKSPVSSYFQSSKERACSSSVVHTYDTSPCLSHRAHPLPPPPPTAGCFHAVIVIRYTAHIICLFNNFALSVYLYISQRGMFSAQGQRPNRTKEKSSHPTPSQPKQSKPSQAKEAKLSYQQAKPSQCMATSKPSKPSQPNLHAITRADPTRRSKAKSQAGQAYL